MNILRKYKIHQLTPVLSIRELEIVNFIESKLSDLKPYYNMVLNDRNLYFMNDEGNCILSFSIHENKFRIGYMGFYKVLEKDYVIEIEDIKILLIYFIEKKYPMYKNISIDRGLGIISDRIEKAYKDEKHNTKI